MPRRQRINFSLPPEVIARLDDEENMSATVEAALRSHYDEL